MARGIGVNGYNAIQVSSLNYNKSIFGRNCQGRKRAYFGSPQIANSAGPSVITVGEALYDCLADQLGKPKEEVETWTPYPGGAPANVATAISRLGIHTIFISAIGNDELGEKFVGLLRDRQVDVRYVQRVDHATRDVLVTRSISGDREFAGFGSSTDSYADCFLSENAIPLAAIQNASACVTGTLGLAYPESRKAIFKVVAAAKSAPGCVLIMDVNWRPVFWPDVKSAHDTISNFVMDADIIKITDEEAEWLLDMPANDALQNPDMVLAKFPNAKGVLVSAGENGSSYSFKTSGGKMNISGLVPVLPVKIADTTGAGDAYLSGFIYYMIKSGGIDCLTADPELMHKAVEFATACGAATCTKPGAIDAQPYVDEAAKLLESTS